MPPTRRRTQLLPHLHSAFYILFHLLPSNVSSPISEWHQYEANVQQEDRRILQNNNDNNVCSHQPSLPTEPTSSTTSSDAVINKVLSYLDEHRPSIEASILVSYTDHHENVTRPSIEYLYDDFRSSLDWMARVGVERPDDVGGGRFTFYMGPDNCDNDGWHVGLANVAAFLGQGMTMGILNDTW